MKPEKLIEVLSVAERLKDAVRHCYTSGGRRESVAEHSWRISLMAYFVSDEFPEAELLKIKEMEAQQTLESRIYKALDKLEALIQHNESDIKTWIPLEYNLQMTYGNEQVKFSDYLTELREQVRADSVRKIEKFVH